MKVLVWLIFGVLVLYGANRGEKCVFVLHSYSQEYDWTKSQHTHFVTTLHQSFSKPLEISTEYLDTKRIKWTDAYQDFFFHYLQAKYQGYHPDAIYVTDDNALQFFIRYHSRLFSSAPIFFSGINNLSLVTSLDPAQFTGVYETKEIEPNIDLIRQFSPQTRDIWFVGDASSTYKAIESEIRKKIRNYPSYHFHFIANSRIAWVIEQLPKKPKTFVILTTIGGWEDEQGKNLMLKESIDLLNRHSHLILCSMEDAYMMGGVVGGFVTSGSKQGSAAAHLLLRYFRGEPISKIASLVKSPNVYMFDRQVVMKSRLILSAYIARHAIILHEKSDFFEKNKKIIMDLFFVFFIFILVFMLGVYFVTRQKKAYVVSLEERLEEQSFELERMQQRLSIRGKRDE